MSRQKAFCAVEILPYTHKCIFSHSKNKSKSKLSNCKRRYVNGISFISLCFLFISDSHFVPLPFIFRQFIDGDWRSPAYARLLYQSPLFSFRFAFIQAIFSPSYSGKLMFIILRSLFPAIFTCSARETFNFVPFCMTNTNFPFCTLEHT